MTYVVDASVVVKWLVPEEGSEQAAALMKLPLMAPDILIAECVNVLWRKAVRGIIDPEHAVRRAHALKGAGIALEPTQPLAPDIIILSLRLNHSAYDCAYLALAQRLDGVLVTADQKLLRRCTQPDTADLARHVCLLGQFERDVQEPRKSVYRARPVSLKAVSFRA